MRKKLLAAFVGLALGMLFVPVPAQAQSVEAGSVTAVFSAQANVGTTDGQTVWAPVTPNGSCPTQSGVGNLPLCEDGGTDYGFDTRPTGTCVAVADGANGPNRGVVVGGTTVNGACALASTGNFFPLLDASDPANPTGYDLGAWCGLSTGEGSVDTAVVGSVDYAAVPPNDILVKWHSSAGTVVPLTAWEDTNGNGTVDETDGHIPPGPGDTPAGQGAVQTTGAQPDTCGIDGTNGSSAFLVSGYLTLYA